MKIFAPAFYNERRGMWDSWSVFPCEFDLREVDERDAPVAATVMTESRYAPDGGRTDRTDYRAFGGMIWEPAYQSRRIWAPGTLVEARPDRLSRLLDLIAREPNNWHDVYRNALADWPWVPWTLREGQLKVDENPVSEKARAAARAVERVASDTIAIDGAPWRRSLGPFLEVAGPAARWLSPAASDLGYHQLTHAVLPQCRDRAETAVREGIGGPSIFGDVASMHTVEINDPEALLDAFDTDALGLEVLARNALYRIRNRTLPEMNPEQVSALAELREAVTARLPRTHVFPMSKDVLSSLERPEGWFDLPPAGDIADRLSRCHEAFPGALDDRTFHRMRAIREFIAEGAPASDPADEDLAALRF